MKKKHVIILLVVILVIGIISLVLCYKPEPSKRIVGIYHNDNWNNSEATISINEDGTCQHPSNSDRCEWSIVEDNVVMKNFTEYTIEGYIDVYLEDNIILYIDEIHMYSNTLKSIENVDSVSGYDTKEKKFRLHIFEDEYIDEIEQQVREYEGIKKTESYKSEAKITTNEYIATIVDGGLILQDHFFKKMN